MLSFGLYLQSLGVFVDRYDRRTIMIAADVLRAILVVLNPFLVPLNVIWLYVIVMLVSAIGQFFDPAHESILPEVATEEELAAANSMIAISSFGSTAVGFAAAGLIASAASLDWAFYANAFTFLFSAVCVFMIRIKPVQAEEDTSVAVVIQNLRAGVKQVVDTPILRSLFMVMAVVLISFGLSNAILLPFSIRALGATVTATHDRNAEWYAPLEIFGPMLLLGSLPWWILALVAAGGPRKAWSTFRAKLGAGDRDLRLLAWWFLLPLAIFSLAQSRPQLYVLPLFVPWALMVSRPLAGWPWLTPARLAATAGVTAAVLLGLKATLSHWPADRDAREMARCIDALLAAHGGAQLRSESHARGRRPVPAHRPTG